MHNTLRFTNRLKAVSQALTAPRLCPSPQILAQPLLPLHPLSPPQLPSLLPCLQQVQKFSCGEGGCPPSRSSRKEEKVAKERKGGQCSSVKGGNKRKKGGQCSAVKKGGQCSAVKSTRGESKSKKGRQCSAVKKGGQCSAVKKGGQCSAVKRKRGESKSKKGRQCSAVKKGGQSSAVKKGGQCSAVKRKRGESKSKKGGQCSPVELKGKRSERKLKHSGSSCSTPEAKNDAAKTKTVICENEDKENESQVKDSSCSSMSISTPPKPDKKETTKKESSKRETAEKEESSSSSSSSSSSDSEPETPKIKCDHNEIDIEEIEKQEKAVTEMCSCIKSALAKPKEGEKSYIKKPGKKEPKAAKPPQCGSPFKTESKPKVSEHVRCCQVETSSFAPLKADVSSCKAKQEVGREKILDEEKQLSGVMEMEEEEKVYSKDDPCECIKNALKLCKSPTKEDRGSGCGPVEKKEEKKSYKEEKKSYKEEKKPDKYDKEDEEEEEPPPNSQCGTKTSAKKGCKGKDFKVKCR